MNYILQTSRLLLREMTIKAAAMVYALTLDPEVIRFTGDSAFESVEHAAEFLASYDHYKLYGY